MSRVGMNRLQTRDGYVPSRLSDCSSFVDNGIEELSPLFLL